MDLFLQEISDYQFSQALMQLKLNQLNTRQKFIWTIERSNRFSKICAVCGVATVTPSIIQRYFKDNSADRQIISSRLQKHRLKLLSHYRVDKLQNCMGGEGSEKWREETFRGYRDSEIRDLLQE
ncbi:hypothetical protein SS50377_20555 [Spironucleus salmonicida]|uniref:Uncharacterized protein n=1 Tax=Spironucleus salmonicida TaxID=348837 RepID=V6LTZ6_9EUKA|nr:hypothetical protein SS50377_20555 [Spironucleus salmonicida]|eukprot:EST48080.1 Hypothetical protein SS50377_11777 [Spironucleus salmonicida]